MLFSRIGQDLQTVNIYISWVISWVTSYDRSPVGNICRLIKQDFSQCPSCQVRPNRWMSVNVRAAVCPKFKMLQSPHFAPNTKMGINAFSTRIRLAKCLTKHISATMRDIGLILKDHLQETTCCGSNGHVTDVTWPQNVMVMTPKSWRLHISEIVWHRRLNWPPIGNRMLRLQRSCDRWRHVTHVWASISLRLNISKTVRDRQLL